MSNTWEQVSRNDVFFCFSWKSWEYVWYYVKWSKIGSCQVEKQIFYLLINECNLQTVPKGGLCFHSLQKGNLLPINHTKKSKIVTLLFNTFCNTHWEKLNENGEIIFNGSPFFTDKLKRPKKAFTRQWPLLATISCQQKRYYHCKTLPYFLSWNVQRVLFQKDQPLI